MTRMIALFTLVLMLSACTDSDIEQPSPDVLTGKMIKELVVNGTTREYIVYVPESYSEAHSLPLVLSFHGLTSNMEFNYNYTKFSELAEREQFIAVHPNGLNNKWTTSSTNNPDIDFTEALIEEIEANYNIASDRIYSTGMSNGGFFSFSLACGLSEKIAAIASVTGTQYSPSINSCSPTRPISILQVHGTEDSIVPYSSVSNLLDFWTTHNATDKTPNVSNIPDYDPKDGSTVQRFEYSNGNEGVAVHHLKVIGGGHQWPGHKGNMDINASEEVWDFIKHFDLNGRIN